ncbi:hypothetical protein T458_12820 [Brevibacillus panacihumi W25]|uniref:Beta-lactamase n=1 Tax=Brevibacillus panacihumi W25 TaxID=1408254 RepID=V6M7T4_9BACL|nr:MBL fold metallo-hydrolase [Brevibacillus panacihumi]EST54574.1 hypothetical protein T458_12820 [Brevibacillus panacihumi W25]
MTILSEVVEKAIYLENRGYFDQAGDCFNYLQQFADELDATVLTRIAQFYLNCDRNIDSLQMAKKAIEKGASLAITGKAYLKAWEKGNLSIEWLEWLQNQPGMENFPEHQLYIAEKLFHGGRHDLGYRLAIQTGEQIEKRVREHLGDFDLFIDSNLLLTELEFLLGNPIQARFHLRKTLYLERERLCRHQEISYWSIVLDEITSWVSREDWHELEERINGEVLMVCQMYRHLLSGKRSKRMMETLHSTPFIDEYLEKKRLTYLALVDRDWTGQLSLTALEEQHARLPDDLLTTLLYTQRLESVDREAAKSVWKREFVKHADHPLAIRAYHALLRSEEGKSRDPILDGCRVTFLGGGEKIGGTSILISIHDRHILLDAGMHLHEESYHPDYQPMFDLGVQYEDLDALLITHAHLDHVGAVPYLLAQRPDLPVYATEATKSLMKVLLTDTVKSSRQQELVNDMYDEEQVKKTLLSVQAVDFAKTFIIPSSGKEWRITYYPAGHILGAASIYMELEGISVLFTGDYSIEDQRTVKGMELPDNLKVDILITESTYGYLPTNASMKRSVQENMFVATVDEMIQSNGSVLIPAFALGRAQEIVLILKEAYKNEDFLPFSLFLDGRVTEVCRIYQDYAELGKFVNPAVIPETFEKPLIFGDGVQAAQDLYSNRKGSSYIFDSFFEDFIAPGKTCVVASSGMLIPQSASSRYAEKMIDSKNCLIAFSGYLDEESAGSHILKKSQSQSLSGGKLQVNGVEKEIRARIEAFRLSAHVSREEIVQLVMELRPSFVFLMHGEHQKRYKPVGTKARGEVIYPSLVELLRQIEGLEVIPAWNGTSYEVQSQGGEHANTQQYA